MVSDIGTSARMIRIGNIEGFSEYANVVYENPAGLYKTKGLSASMFTTEIMQEVRYINLCMSTHTAYGTFGFGYMSAGVSDIPKTFENPLMGKEFDSNSSFNYENIMAKLAYQVSQTKNLHFGITGTYTATNLDTIHAKGYNMDIGAVYDVEKFAISIALRNIIPSMKVNYINEAVSTYNASEVMPLQSVFSVKYKWNDELTVFGQLKQTNNLSMTNACGINFRPLILPLINVSGGYKQFPVLNKVKSNYVFGIGLDLLGVSFDAAYEKSEHFEFDNKIYFSVGVTY